VKVIGRFTHNFDDTEWWEEQPDDARHEAISSPETNLVTTVGDAERTDIRERVIQGGIGVISNRWDAEVARNGSIERIYKGWVLAKVTANLNEVGCVKITTTFELVAVVRRSVKDKIRKVTLPDPGW
jgi:hypothetical protein